eukprot:1481883-Rhodomonas_salina.1
MQGLLHLHAFLAWDKEEAHPGRICQEGWRGLRGLRAAGTAAAVAARRRGWGFVRQRGRPGLGSPRDQDGARHSGACDL